MKRKKIGNDNKKKKKTKKKFHRIKNKKYKKIKKQNWNEESDGWMWVVLWFWFIHFKMILKVITIDDLSNK